MMEQSQPRPLLAVRAIITNDAGEVLILKRAPDNEYGNLWNLPGGKVDYGQTAEEALIREVEEETSLACTSVQFLFYLDGLPEEEGERHYLTLFFKCKVTGNLLLNGESASGEWAGTEVFRTYDMAFRNDEAILRYLSYEH